MNTNNIQNDAASGMKDMSAEEVLALMDKDLEALKAMSEEIKDAHGDIANFKVSKKAEVAGIEEEEERVEAMNEDLDLSLNAALDEFVETEEKEEIAGQSQSA